MFYSRKAGALVMGIVAIFIMATHFPAGPIFDLSSASTMVNSDRPDLFGMASFFLMVGTFSFGGGLTLIAFIQDQVVAQHQWLTQREFIDGLALGQLTPGPILMVSAYIGYKLQGVVGAALAATAMFLPAFALMLVILPMFEKVRRLAWTKAAMKGIGPAVIGVLVVSLLQMAPHAVPDVFAMLMFAGALTALLAWRLGVMKLMIAGACLGILRHRFP
jgi:chromate transporter